MFKFLDGLGGAFVYVYIHTCSYFFFLRKKYVNS